MSDKNLQTPRCHLSGNYILSGRQLPRTPPLTDVKKCLSFSDPDVDLEIPKWSMEEVSRDQDKGLKPDSPHCMLKGMKGYQLTESDLDFIRKMKEEQLIKKLQGELKELQKQLMKDSMTLDLAYASRKMAQDELNKFPSCEDLSKWATMVLRTTSPSMELDDMDLDSLLAAVTMENIRSFMAERNELDRLKRTAAEMKNRKDEEKRQLEKQIASEELKIEELMEQLAELRSELLEQEKEPDESKEPQAAKSKVKHHGGDGKKDVKCSENLQEATIKGKTTRRKHTNTRDVLKTRPEEKEQKRPGARPESRPLRGKPLKVVEEKVPERAERKKGEPAGAAPKAASQAKSQRNVTSEETRTKSHQASHSRKKGAEGEAPGLGLRRSKRIANRK